MAKLSLIPSLLGEKPDGIMIFKEGKIEMVGLLLPVLFKLLGSFDNTGPTLPEKGDTPLINAVLLMEPEYPFGEIFNTSITVSDCNPNNLLGYPKRLIWLFPL